MEHPNDPKTGVRPTKNYSECTHQNEPPKPPGFVERYCRHLKEVFDIRSLIDVGCGNGEYVRGFRRAGVSLVRGLDRHSECDIQADIEGAVRGLSPAQCVHAKSLIEHLRYPERAIAHMRNLLFQHGLIILLTPDIDCSKWSFWGDFGHVHPFNRDSLYQLLDYAELKDIHVERFYKGILDESWKKPLKGMLIGWGRK